jgi:hypothetical protein
LDQFVLVDTGVALDVVDVLCVVGEELALVLEQADELVRWGPFRQVWEDISGEGIKDAVNVRTKALLGIHGTLT